MPPEISTSYDLALVARPTTLPSPAPQQPVQELDIGAFVPDPFRLYEVESGHEIVSVAQQLVVSFSPPRIRIADLSGSSPARPEFLTMATGLVEAMAKTEIEIAAFGWNLDILIRNADMRQTVGWLFDTAKVCSFFDIRPDHPWNPKRVEFAVPSHFADQLNVTLFEESDASESDVRFAINAHFQTTPKVAEFDQQSRDFGEIAQRLISGMEGRGAREGL